MWNAEGRVSPVWVIILVPTRPWKIGSASYLDTLYMCVCQCLAAALSYLLCALARGPYGHCTLSYNCGQNKKWFLSDSQNIMVVINYLLAFNCNAIPTAEVT